jgi:hypothetical protein
MNPLKSTGDTAHEPIVPILTIRELTPFAVSITAMADLLGTSEAEVRALARSGHLTTIRLETDEVVVIDSARAFVARRTAEAA